MTPTTASTTTGTGADVLARALADAGIGCAYGIPGQRILPFFHALDQAGVPIVLTRHEQGAAFMADAHARIAGLGVCMSTSGPGAINMLGGLAAAYMDSVPLLAITAQAATGEFGHYGIQEGTGLGRTPDIPAMCRSTVKESWQATRADELGPLLAEALTVARSGRPGPVHLDIPSDLFTAPALDADGASPPTGAVNGADAVDAALVEVAADALRGAKRPLVLAGGGLAAPATARLLLDVAEAADLPVATSFAAKRYLDEHHPLALGPVGTYGRAAANHALHHEADLVLALGVAFSYLTTAGWTARLPADRLIRVDIDPRELANTYQGGIAVKATTRAFLTALHPHAERIAGHGARRADVLRRRHPDPSAPLDAADGRLHPVTVCEAVNRHLDDRTTVLADVGQNAYWVERYLRTRGDNRFLINAGLGSMGHAVAGAVGAWQARTAMGGPGERVLVTTGDGGFLMGALEISTAVAEQAAITWVVFNNGTLGTQQAWFDREGHRPVACQLPDTDLVALAKSLGANGRRVHTPQQLEDGLDWALKRAAPTVLDVVIDPTPAPAPYTPEEPR
ncbi:thiamine pyrophosphate-binding protein [Streptomyces sp. NPDC002920]